MRTIPPISRATLYLPKLKRVSWVQRRIARNIQRAVAADVAEEGGSCGEAGEAEKREKDSGEAGELHSCYWDA